MSSKLINRAEPSIDSRSTGVTIVAAQTEPEAPLPAPLTEQDLENGHPRQQEEVIQLLGNPDGPPSGLFPAGKRSSLSERIGAKFCYPRPGKPLEGYRFIWANFICALSVFAICGIWSLVLTWQDENLHFVNPTPATADGTDHGSILTLPASIALSFIVRNRNWFYLVTILINFVCALADPRGNLPGVPILRNFFNLLNWTLRIFSILSFINTTYVIYHASSKILYEASALLILGWICKFVGQTRTGYTYTGFYAAWQNLCSFSIVCVYWYK